MMALSSSKDVYVWGHRMGIYPQVELRPAALKMQGNVLIHEINQSSPRHVKNNLVFRKISKIVAGPENAALITEEGELLIQGSNTCNQIVLSTSLYAHEEIAELLFFFPEFMQIDFF